MIYTGRVDGVAYVEIIKDALPMFIEIAFDAGNRNYMTILIKIFNEMVQG